MTERVMIWLVFEQEGAFLLARRKPEERPFAGQWTLPGDVMRDDESASETVQRFAAAELGIKVGAEEFIDTFYLSEGETSYAVTVFKPASFEGRLRYRDSGPYAEVRWATPPELPSPMAQPLAEMLGGKRHWQSDEPTEPAGPSA